MGNFSAIILAAGQGTRMKSDRSKVLHEICFKPLIRWVYDACEAAECENIIMVVGHMKNDVISAMGNDNKYAVQETRLGTGHAVMMAEEYFENYDGTVVVLNGDTPLISSDTIKNAINYHEKSGSSATVISARIENPFGYGRIVRDADGTLSKIVEQKDANEQEKGINEINSGMYCFNSKDLFSALSKVQNNNSQGEYYLTDTIDIIKSGGKKVDAYVMDDSREILGVNDRYDLSVAANLKREQINKLFMLSGVTFLDSASAIIDIDAQIGVDTIIYPNVIIKGRTYIGSECIIGPDSTIENSHIASGVTIKNSVILDSDIGEGTTVGPFAYIRPNSKVGKCARIGDFVEIKNSNIGDCTKVSHLTYVGDSDVGKRVNFGCGTVTVNYDGDNKYRTTIGDDVFIGCNANLVAPLTINNKAFIAAGSTITNDVEENSLAIARSRQMVKTNWRKK